MNAPYGWRGKILRVNLTRGELYEEELSEDLKNNYIGGAGKLEEGTSPALNDLLAKG